MSTARLISLFTYTYLENETIMVYDKDQTWLRLTIDEYNQKFTTTMLHGVVCDNKHAALVPKIKEYFAKIRYVDGDTPLIEKFITNPINYTFITYTTSLCGYAQIANQNIPAKTIIGTYSAELILRGFKESSVSSAERIYDMGVYLGNIPENKDSILKLTSEEKEIKYYCSFRANKVGELTRFALHAPNATKLAQLKKDGYFGDEEDMDEIDESKILTCNTDYNQEIYKDTPIRYYKTMIAIEQYSLILINYGDGYWSEHRAPQAKISKGNNKTLGMPCLFMRDANQNNELRILEFDLTKNRYYVTQQRIVLPTQGPNFVSHPELKRKQEDKPLLPFFKSKHLAKICKSNDKESSTHATNTHPTRTEETSTQQIRKR